MNSIGIMFLSTFAVLSSAAAVAEPAQQPAPKTKLEAFTGETGVVMIKGYTEIGSVNATGTISVDAMTLRNARTGTESSGIVMTLRTLAPGLALALLWITTK
jgi:hypothetical protein